ncbi:MAG: hypothetical protein B6244_14690 [Candidatus Cloacimonetes bacterium 4572_55]|nr:MAG: hypothetical protein B6244_14690 [Candidatus Cloacimonetes bacterium 4572_55]
MTIKKAVETIAALGGFRITGSAKHPGFEALWHGYYKLCEDVHIIKLAWKYLGLKDNEFM